MKNFWKIAVVLFVSLAATGCVTTKKKGSQKVGWFKKGYHNMTSHYNYWFNANELMNTSVAKLNEAHKDNYNQILDIYPYMATDPQPTKGDMDNVITKTAKAISIHRVSDWTDDNYLLFAQAQHLKKDFETAETSFQFIKEELDPHKKLPKTKLKKGKKKEDTKKKKSKKKKKKKVSAKKKKAAKAKAAKEKAAKEKAAAEAAKQPVKPKTEEPVAPLGNDPYSAGGFKRRSAWPDAMIWYGRTLIEREKYEEAEYHFQQLAEDPFFPNALRDDLATAEAYNWMKQKRYDRAIPPLSRAIQLTTKKKQRARLAYILAQLYDRAGRHEEAYAAFDKVLGSRPTFEMEFNARLQQIESGWENGKITAKDADKTLNRMAAEAKNADYRDQIHFTLASIALKENEKTAAIAYLRQSLASNKGNASQRAESYLKLAELYFEAEDFVLAKNYYDSTLTVLAATDERYKQVDLFAKNLTDIARLITTIAANDSIVRVYNMSDGERKDLAKKLKKQREEETALADAEAAKKEKEKPAPGSAPKSGPVAGAKASSFYFYNEAFVKKGKKDFQKTWGDRKLEDNWRRSSRRPNQDGNDELAAADSTKTDGVSDAELDDIFQSLPKSTEELAVIHLATYDAMYQLGVLYRDKLQNNRRSTGTLEDMQARYPDTTKHEKEAWYYCFVGFTDLENPPKAKEYYDKLVAKYPNSSYARAISDPNFINAQKQREKEVNDYYETAYGDFKKGQYKPAFDKCEDAPRKFGSQNPMMPKFALLSALCIGNLQGKDAYCGALSDVIGRFPQSNEATRAKEIARLLGCKGFEVADVPKRDSGEQLDEKFTLEDDKLHYFLVAIDNSENNVKLDDVKAAVSDYNREFHKLEQLRISNIFLGTDTQTPIVVLRKFDNRTAAMKYLREVEAKKDFLGENAKREYTKEFFVITQENYRRVLKNKTLDGYREFFDENYQN